MSRTGRIITGIVIVVVLVLIAWSLGWFGTQNAASSGSAAVANGAAAASGSMSVGAQLAQSLSIIDAQVQTVASDTAAYTSAPYQGSLPAVIAHIQVATTLFSQMEGVLHARATMQNQSALQASITNIEQSLSTVQSQIFQIQTTLKTSATLDTLALRLAGTRLKTALAALQKAELNVKSAITLTQR